MKKFISRAMVAMETEQKGNFLVILATVSTREKKFFKN